MIDRLKLNDRLTKRRAIVDISECFVIGDPRQGKAVNGIVQPFHVEACHELPKMARSSYDILLGDPAIRQDDLAMRQAPAAEPSDPTQHFAAWRSLFDQHAPYASGARDRVEASEDGVEFVVRRTGDKPLMSVDDEMIAIGNGRRLQVRQIRAMIGFGQRDSAADMPTDNGRKIFLPRPVVLGKENHRRPGTRGRERTLAQDPRTRRAYQFLDHNGVIEGVATFPAIFAWDGQ